MPDRGNCLKRGLGECIDLMGGGSWQKKEGIMFLRGGGLLPQCTPCVNPERLRC